MKNRKNIDYQALGLRIGRAMEDLPRKAQKAKVGIACNVSHQQADLILAGVSNQDPRVRIHFGLLDLAEEYSVKIPYIRNSK